MGFVPQVVEATVEFIQKIGMTLGDEADRAEQEMLDRHLATARVDSLVGGWGRRWVGHTCATTSVSLAREQRMTECRVPNRQTSKLEREDG